jgi:hypothetical protein
LDELKRLFNSIDPGLIFFSLIFFYSSSPQAVLVDTFSTFSFKLLCGDREPLSLGSPAKSGYRAGGRFVWQKSL